MFQGLVSVSVFRRLCLRTTSETKTGSICRVRLSHLKTETEFRLQNIVLQIKDRTIYNIQNCDKYTIQFICNYGVSYFQERVLMV
jgi:hypothetical protein